MRPAPPRCDASGRRGLDRRKAAFVALAARTGGPDPRGHAKLVGTICRKPGRRWPIALPPPSWAATSCARCARPVLDGSTAWTQATPRACGTRPCCCSWLRWGYATARCDRCSSATSPGEPERLSLDGDSENHVVVNNGRAARCGRPARPSPKSPHGMQRTERRPKNGHAESGTFVRCEVAGYLRGDLFGEGPARSNGAPRGQIAPAARVGQHGRRRPRGPEPRSA